MAEVPVQNKEGIETRVKKVVAGTLSLDLKEITPETSLDNLNLDSLERVELLMDLEEEFKEFKIDISDEEAEKIQTVGKIIKLIEAKARGC